MKDFSKQSDVIKLLCMDLFQFIIISTAFSLLYFTQHKL